MEITPTKVWVGIGGVAGTLVSIFAVITAWQSLEWRPATIGEVRAEVGASAAKAEIKLAQVQEQTTETKSLLLNDLLLRTQKAIYENLREQERQKTTCGCPDVQPWLIDEWLRLEKDQQDYQIELDQLLGN